jgi:hypothetical protein
MVTFQFAMLVYQRVILGGKDYLQLPYACWHPAALGALGSSDLHPRRRGIHSLGKALGQHLSDEAKGLFPGWSCQQKIDVPWPASLTIT